jgi:hypothetical protein
MKNKTTILFILVFSLLAFGFAGCEDETTAGFTGITYYPDIVMEGDETVFVPLGGNYVDPGATATENGVPIDVTSSSTLNTEVIGTYFINYTAVNVDGFSKTVRRKIYVYDSNLNTNDLSGTYNANVSRVSGSASESYSNNPVTLTSSSIPGLYYIDDWIAGFYAIGRDYGDSYKFKGLIQINGDNEVLELDMSNPWGDPFSSVIGSYNPNTGVIAYSAAWLTYTFVVDMAKQ